MNEKKRDTNKDINDTFLTKLNEYCLGEFTFENTVIHTASAMNEHGKGVTRAITFFHNDFKKEALEGILFHMLGYDFEKLEVALSLDIKEIEYMNKVARLKKLNQQSKELEKEIADFTN